MLVAPTNFTIFLSEIYENLFFKLINFQFNSDASEAVFIDAASFPSLQSKHLCLQLFGNQAKYLYSCSLQSHHPILSVKNLNFYGVFAIAVCGAKYDDYFFYSMSFKSLFFCYVRHLMVFLLHEKSLKILVPKFLQKRDCDPFLLFVFYLFFSF